jgi:LuxR family transcriptional regulator, maltose regulon positive regulatory protein
VLEGALELAEAEGLRRGLADAGPGLAPLLAHLQRHGTQHRSLIGEVAQLLDGAAAAPTMASGAADSLSVRELAVLRYLPTMLTAPEIAAELFVTLNTVKTHLKSIYRKLGVSGRREAVARGRQLGLVAPGAAVVSARRAVVDAS